eukprot:3021018-Rhodomonas_salina.1
MLPHAHTHAHAHALHAASAHTLQLLSRASAVQAHVVLQQQPRSPPPDALGRLAGAAVGERAGARALVPAQLHDAGGAPRPEAREPPPRRRPPPQSLRLRPLEAPRAP